MVEFSRYYSVRAMVFSLKFFMILYVFIWIRGTLPRFRFDQLMRYGWKIFLPVALGNVIVSAGVLLQLL